MVDCDLPIPTALVIEAVIPPVDGEHCTGCGDIVGSVRVAAEELRAELESLNVQVTFMERPMASEDLESSSPVIINGRPIEEWLFGAMLGQGVCCSAVLAQWRNNGPFTAEQLRIAAFSALGLGEGRDW